MFPWAPCCLVSFSPDAFSPKRRFARLLFARAWAHVRPGALTLGRLFARRLFAQAHFRRCAQAPWRIFRPGAWKERRRANRRRAQGCPGGNAPGPERHAKPRNGTRKLHRTKHRCASYRATQQAIKHRARTRRAPHFTNRANTPRQALRATGDGSGMTAEVMSGKSAARAPGRRRPGSRAEAHRPPHQIPELALHRAAHGDSRDSCDSHRH